MSVSDNVCVERYLAICDDEQDVILVARLLHDAHCLCKTKVVHGHTGACPHLLDDGCKAGRTRSLDALGCLLVALQDLLQALAGGAVGLEVEAVAVVGGAW